MRAAKQRAKAKSLSFNLDLEWAQARWTGYCELSGLAFSPPENRIGYKNRNMTPSIDRIDPNKGYTKDNCQFILWALNSLKRDGTFDEMCQIIIAFVKKQKLI